MTALVKLFVLALLIALIIILTANYRYITMHGDKAVINNTTQVLK